MRKPFSKLITFIYISSIVATPAFAADKSPSIDGYLDENGNPIVCIDNVCSDTSKVELGPEGQRIIDDATWIAITALIGSLMQIQMQNKANEAFKNVADKLNQANNIPVNPKNPPSVPLPPAQNPPTVPSPAPPAQNLPTVPSPAPSAPPVQNPPKAPTSSPSPMLAFSTNGIAR